MLIDTSVHPILADQELFPLIGKPWSDGRLPDPMGLRHVPPDPGVIIDPGLTADPAEFARVLFGERGVDVAVISPLTRGLEPNPQVAAAVARATNTWVADRWLSQIQYGGRFAGSIRLPVTNVAASLAEIRTWADDPRFVQVAVPMRTFVPYGDDTYLPIWEAVADLGLPVAIYDDYATGVAHPESPVGTVRYFAEKFAATPFSDIVHMATLITCGIFDRVPGLKVIFGDASVDLGRVMLWRLEKDWRSGRVEIPWVERIPSQYAQPHLRFVSHPEDGVADGATVSPDLLGISDAEHLVLFGSHFPYWDAMDAKTVYDQWPGPIQDRVLSGNALEAMPRLASFLKSQTNPQ